MQDLIGTEIGGYLIESLLDDGGTGIVYTARKPRTDKLVTLKIVSIAKSGDLETVQRYMREMRLLGELSHPHIKSIITWGITSDERPYLVSDYIEGGTLKALMQSTPLSPAATWRILEPLADALAYLHRQNVIHRNIKPKKILVEAETGKVYLNDFGSSKQLGVDATLANSAMSIAPVVSPEYMSPELAHTTTTEIDYRTDLYSLGVTTYEMLLGQTPFPASQSYMQLALAHLYTAPPPPTGLNPAFPPALEAVLLKSLEKDPANRYQTADELGAAYHAALTSLGEEDQKRVYWV